MEKEKFMEMCKAQFITWEDVEKDIERLFKRNAIDLSKCDPNDYKEVYAVMDAVYRHETYGYTNGSLTVRVNATQKRKSTKYYGYL